MTARKVLKFAQPLILSFALLSAAGAAAEIPQAVVEVCNEYRYTSEKQACLADLSGIYFVAEAAANICKEYRYTTERQSCLKAIGGPIYPQGVVQVCNEYRYTSEKQACLVDLREVESIAPEAIAICNEYRYTNEKQQCLKRSGGSRIPAAVVAVCNEYRYTSEKESCLAATRQIGHIAAVSVRVCNEYRYTNEKQSCMIDLGNLRIDEAAGNICLEYRYTNEKQSCLKSIGNNEGGGEGQLLSHQLLRKLRLAANAVRSGDQSLALDLLEELKQQIQSNANQINH